MTEVPVDMVDVHAFDYASMEGLVDQLMDQLAARDSVVAPVVARLLEKFVCLEAVDVSSIADQERVLGMALKDRLCH